ncbi:protein dalmatian [Drosophila eugracilis]|uniref:protein dalmatian n=1 Tax=Drosophila eugracilis TaxID=29029 RepID=UPI0007E80E9F|nr:protein dalmatian [Drosophila eugracilis]
MVKRRGRPCSTASNLKTKTRSNQLRGKKLSSEAISVITKKPQCSLRKCVVRIKRIKIQDGVASVESQRPVQDVNISAFEPARNSTMYVPQKVQIINKPKITKKKLADHEKSPCKLAVKVSPKKPSRFFHRDQPQTRTRSSEKDNVFDFLSQSQIDDDNNKDDPAADIIKRLMDNGKACVMVRSNTGKIRAKRSKNIRPVGKRKICLLKDVDPVSSKIVTDEKETRIQQPPRALSPIYEPEDDSSNDLVQNFAEPIEVPVQVHVEPSTSKQMHEGAYSSLARSAMLKQTQAQNRPKLTDRRRELINMARQLVSTPLNRKIPPIPEANSTVTAISPITRQSPNAVSPAGPASPWRVSDESPMPNTFRFGFNTSQLPSYSSDHMRRPHVYVPDAQAEQSEKSTNEEPGHEESICPPLHEQSRDSNANDSNGENCPPPPTSKSMALNDQENAENFVHLPNPRRTLQKRVPFKDINILEVVMLPPWKKNVQTTPSKEKPSNIVSINPAATSSPLGRSQTRTNLFGFDEIVPCVNIPNKTPDSRNAKTPPSKSTISSTAATISESVASPAHRSETRVNLFGSDEILPCDDIPRTKARASPSRNLFGFDEFISESEDLHPGTRSPNRNVTLHDKLHRLAELRPSDSELPQVSTNPIRGDYLEKWHQKDIREVFCSTMIAAQATPKPLAAVTARESFGLFREDQAEPEKTFDEKKPRRTYVKERPQRKRKKRVQILYIESESEDEVEQDSLEKSSDSPQKKQPQSKRPRRDIDHEAKLQEYITSFNKECEEVEKFPLIIE